MVDIAGKNQPVGNLKADAPAFWVRKAASAMFWATSGKF
jgi:hypothetical protein